MSDLTERLRTAAIEYTFVEGRICNEAADRIDELEAALREIRVLGNPPPSFRVAESLFAAVARRALGDNDD